MAEKHKAPAYQWYPKDYESDEAVRLMTYEQEGIYRRLLDHQALHGSIPAHPDQIAMLVPKVQRSRFLKLWPAIAVKFPMGVDGRLVNNRLARSQREHDEFIARQVASGRLGAHNRWARHSGANGGANGEPYSDANASPLAKSCSSSASASPNKKRAFR